MNEEQQIRDLIERWATAVHDGDLHTVLAGHSPDIVMFDVPPPQQGVRGVDAYRDTWPGFFQWQAAGAVFEIESLEVTAGADVAFAFALLRCGTPVDFERDPDHRLRLTIGLRKIDDRWTVTHEHHSFADPTETPERSAAEVRAVHEHWFERTAAKDLDGLMEHIAPDIVSYEHAGALQYVGIEDVREVCPPWPGRPIRAHRVRHPGPHHPCVRRPRRGLGARPRHCRRRRIPIPGHSRLSAPRRRLADDPSTPVRPTSGDQSGDIRAE